MKEHPVRSANSKTVEERIALGSLDSLALVALLFSQFLIPVQNLESLFYFLLDTLNLRPCLACGL